MGKKERDLDWVIFPILVLAIAAMFFSCVTEKQRAEICLTCPHKDSTIVKDTTIFKDTTIYITQISEPIVIENPCDSLGILKKFDIKKKSNGIVSELKSDGKTVECDCKDDSLQEVIKQVRADHYREIDSTKEEKVECDKVHKEGIDYFCNWFTIIVGGLLLIYFIIKLIKYF